MSRFYEYLYISWIILFSEISFQVQVTGRIGKSRLGLRLGFDLKQCFIDFIDSFSNNETRIMINNFNLRGLILMKLEK